MARAATSIDYRLAGASHRGRQRLLHLQRARVVRAPHHREAVAVTEPVAQRQPLLATAAAHVARARAWTHVDADRSEEHTSELQSLMRISYAVFCLKKKKYRRTKLYIKNLNDTIRRDNEHSTNER